MLVPTLLAILLAPPGVEELKKALAEAKSPEERSRLILAAPADRADVVPVLCRYLQPCPGDLKSALPLAAAESLARFRGDRRAAEALGRSLPSFRKVPALHRRLVLALGRVGHEASLPLLLDLLRGGDAPLALEAIAEMPAALAVEACLREWERVGKEGEEANRLGSGLLKTIQTLTGEKYPSLAEWQVWWKKRGAAFRESAAAREKERKPGGAAAIPAVPLVEFRFSENAQNTGLLAAAFPEASGTPRPVWPATVPPGGGPNALDGAVDLAGAADALRNLKSFTLAGWLNPRSGGRDGRIVHWLHPKGDGVDLAWRADGSLQLGVDESADLSAAKSPAGLIPALAPGASDEAVGQNWRFFAVTYDAGKVRFHAGTPSQDVAPRGEAEVSRGAVGPRTSRVLSIGNACVRLPGRETPFPGLIDEIRIYASGVDGSAALGLPELLKIQGRQP